METGMEMERALTAGCQWYVPKPIEPDTLVKTVRLLVQGVPAPETGRVRP